MNWTRHETEQEEANYGACVMTAQKAGYTVEQAENCDAGDLGCPDCPWKK